MKQTPFFVHFSDAPKLYRRNDIAKSPLYSCRTDAPESTFIDFGFAPVFEDEKPTDEGKMITRNALPDLRETGWAFGWSARDLTAQEIEDRHPFQTFEEARVAMLGWINDFLSPFTMDAGAAEPLSWVKKEAAAKAYLAGTATTDQTDMIETEAAVDGETPADLCTAIVAQGGLYTKVIAATTGLRRKTLKALEQASLPSEFTAILDGAKVQANAMMQQLSQGN